MTKKILLRGFNASQGKVKGIVKIIRMDIDEISPDDFVKQFDKIEEGNILVTKMTRPDFLPVIEKASAIITDEGGLLCHAAICAREFGKVCVTGTQNATKILRDGQRVVVDGVKGIVYEE